jgi:hypothetical protein
MFEISGAFYRSHIVPSIFSQQVDMFRGTHLWRSSMAFVGVPGWFQPDYMNKALAEVLVRKNLK